MKDTQARTAWRAFAAQVPRERLRQALHAAVDAFIDELTAEEPTAPRARRRAAEKAVPQQEPPPSHDPPEAVIDPEVLALESELRRKGVIL